MRKLLVILLAGMILFSAFGNVAAQEEDCDDEGIDCVTCRNNNFYYVLVIALIIFTVFFYLRNREKIDE